MAWMRKRTAGGLATLVACALPLSATLGTGPTTSGGAPTAYGADPLRDVTAELGPRLSPCAQIFLPGSRRFAEATSRWSDFVHLGFRAVVAVATEEDIEETVKHANAKGLPFLAIGGGHGVSVTLNKLKNGIGIWTRPMKRIAIEENGTVARLQPGVKGGEVTKVLWDQGKQAVSTGCDCVGFIGPVLGGGHGWLQGQFGLVTDNVLSVRLVLANGTAITVSGYQNADLFWAIRGAGHNFGIVASVEYRIFDRTPQTDSWAYEEYVFSGDKLELVYAIANGWLGGPSKGLPVELTHFGHIINLAGYDHPVLNFWIIWQGSTIPAKYVDPIRALGPTTIKTGTVTTPELNTVAGVADGSPLCSGGGVKVQFPVGARSYNLSALRAAYDIFSTYPPWLAGSVVLLEGYSTDAVKRVPPKSTAYPERFNELLLATVFIYTDNTAENYQTVKALARKIERVLVEGTGDELYAYINYAHGDEKLSEVYGHEPWRLQKLRRLKSEWDPDQKFGFFMPIV